MSRIYLVRHAKAAARFDEDPDPSLSDDGKEAAVDLALEIESLGPMPIYTSPMERARETALPLANRWGLVPEVSAAFSEIPTPPEIAEQGIKARGLAAADCRSALWRAAIDHSRLARRPDRYAEILSQRYGDLHPFHGDQRGDERGDERRPHGGDAARLLLLHGGRDHDAWPGGGLARQGSLDQGAVSSGDCIPAAYALPPHNLCAGTAWPEPGGPVDWSSLTA